MRLARKFKPPQKHDEEQWEKIRFLFDHGFRFATVYDDAGLSVAYPATLKDAREFVTRYSPRPPRGIPLRRGSGRPG
jgi:hypothetical protein